MDDRRFDSLVKSFAGGTSRRSVFKGFLGLGGATVVGGSLADAQRGAARRPTPYPQTIQCPGQQIWTGTACVCPGTAPSKCGPACCTNSITPPNTPAYSECCDNACCFGHCYGEELCCEFPLVFCEAQNECCTPDKHQCCGAEGCCDHECCPLRMARALVVKAKLEVLRWRCMYSGIGLLLGLGMLRLRELQRSHLPGRSLQV